MPRHLFLATIATAVFRAAPCSAQDLLIDNARIVDPASRTITNGSIWIRAGEIVAVGNALSAPTTTARLDAAGKWIIPGLVDLHTHSFGNAAPGRVFDGAGTARTASRVPRAGVTAFLDLFGEETSILALRDSQRVKPSVAAEIFAAGPCFTATKGHCSEYGIPTRLIDSPEDARRQLAALAPKRPDVVKVVYDHFNYGSTSMPSIDLPTLRALVSAAKDAGLKTVVHVGTWQDVRDAVLAGAAAVTHVGRDGMVPADIGPLLASRGVALIPTLVVHTDLAEYFDRPSLLSEQLARELSSDTLRAAYRQINSLDSSTRRWIERQREARVVVLESARRIRAAGASVLVGTDAGNWGTIHGYSVHRELARLVEIGASPWEALAAATTQAGVFLGRRYGVRVGDVANLVVLDASPIEDIANTQRVSSVILHGKLVFAR